MPRLFVAVWPPEEVVGELLSLPRKDLRGVRFMAPETWHITLRFLGDASIADAIDALNDVPLAPATVHLGPAVDVLGERALVVPATGLDELATTVRSVTSSVGEPERGRFTGHLTIARLKPHVPMPKPLGAPISATFEVDEIALVLSRLGPQGARYETIDTWPVG